MFILIIPPNTFYIHLCLYFTKSTIPCQQNPR